MTLRWPSRRASRLLALALAAAAPRPAAAQAVASWEASISTIRGPDVSGRTVRQFARISVGGTRLRLRFSNEAGTRPLAIADVHVALPGTAPGSVQPATDRAVLFDGQPAVAVPPGAGVLSDAIDMPVQPLTRLAVSAFFRSASPLQVGHLTASETNYVVVGDHAAEATLAGGGVSYSGFHLSGISVEADGLPGGSVACLGDSITDGADSTLDAERRYPDRLAERLLAASRGRVGAIDAGITGNRVLVGDAQDTRGPSALARLSRDVLSRPGVRWLIVFEGINDIIGPPDAGDTAAELIAAYVRIIARAREAGLKVFGATLTPVGGPGSAFASEAIETARQRVNAWIRTSNAYDAVFDFDAAVRSPADPSRLRAAYDSGDHVHLDDAGYYALAYAVPLGAILPGR